VQGFVSRMWRLGSSPRQGYAKAVEAVLAISKLGLAEIASFCSDLWSAPTSCLVFKHPSFCRFTKPCFRSKRHL
jgi:hypothetical protein